MRLWLLRFGESDAPFGANALVLPVWLWQIELMFLMLRRRRTPLPKHAKIGVIFGFCAYGICQVAFLWMASIQGFQITV
jgi:hypothetical protein